ncbi:hypothetical protein NTE19_003344 [Vibrio fluvialis]|nr:hypothetical protein [Vibrio fluvialis]
MANRQEKPFVQRVMVNGEELNRDKLVSVAYIENGDLSSPSLIAEIDDSRGDIRDDMGLVEGAEIIMEFGDVYGEGRSMLSETFVVRTAPIQNGVIRAQGFSSTLHQLKQPCSSPVFFVEKSVGAILSALCPGVRLDCSVVGVGTYHLNYDMPKSRLIRNMARDFGAAVWLNRGVLHFHKLETLMGRAPVMKAGLNDRNVDLYVHSHDVIRDKPLNERIKQKNYGSWAIDKGFEYSSTHNDKSQILLAYPPKNKLDNISKYMQPLLWFECAGNSDLEPMSMLEFSMLRLSREVELDESLPANMLITQITHYAAKERYLNKIQVGVMNA